MFEKEKEQLGQEIKSLRTQQGLSQEKFASVLGVTTRTVQYWEAGKCLNSGTLRLLCLHYPDFVPWIATEDGQFDIDLNLISVMKKEYFDDEFYELFMSIPDEKKVYFAAIIKDFLRFGVECEKVNQLLKERQASGTEPSDGLEVN